ncbi:hypothetical protein ACFUAG_21920 [Streptomyces sp. NPDC057193]|uniref:hypothetical protein n=1 Tax=Streptomyces sp. NPDC057193 TaxID=3346043 RepID=UPI003641F322
MMSSLDWAGLAPAIAAAVQTAAVVVQVYWDRRQRGAWMTQHPVFGAPVPARTPRPAPGSLSVHVQLGGVLQTSGTPVSVIVRVSDMDGQALPSAKEHGPW